MEAEGKRPFIVLMHGDREVSTKNLARHMGVKAVHPCDFAEAQRHTGYLVGGTSPFGTRTHLHVYAERTIFDLPKIYINGGKRGFLVSIDPRALREVLHAEEVEVAIEKGA
jgi:Cys-tRNA(Pro) deacylase